MLWTKGWWNFVWLANPLLICKKERNWKRKKDKMFIFACFWTLNFRKNHNDIIQWFSLNNDHCWYFAELVRIEWSRIISSFFSFTAPHQNLHDKVLSQLTNRKGHRVKSTRSSFTRCVSVCVCVSWRCEISKGMRNAWVNG